jgi:hypothetical protein
MDHAPEADAAFITGTENVLEVHQRPHGPACLDEATKRLIKEIHVADPARLCMASPTCL